MSEMQVTTSPTLNWCIAVSPKFDELPRPKSLQRLRQKKGRNPPFRWHADRPEGECAAQDSGVRDWRTADDERCLLTQRLWQNEAERWRRTHGLSCSSLSRTTRSCCFTRCRT